MKIDFNSLLENIITKVLFEEHNVQIDLTPEQAQGLASVLSKLQIDPETVVKVDEPVGTDVIPEASKPKQPKEPKYYMSVSPEAMELAKKYFAVGERAQEWYWDAHAVIDNSFESEEDKLLFSLLLAATSVQNEVYGNFIEALSLFKAIKEDMVNNPELLKQFGFDDTIDMSPRAEVGILEYPIYQELELIKAAKGLKVMGVASKFGNVKEIIKRYTTHSLRKEDVISALTGSANYDLGGNFDSRSPMLGRLKIANYALTLLDPEIASSDLNPFNVVVDTWMFRAFFPEKLPATMSTEEQAPILSQLFGSEKAYKTVADAVSKLAAEAGVSPHEMQAAIWTGIKVEREGEKAQTSNYVQAINRLVDDYNHLFNQMDAEVQNIAKSIDSILGGVTQPQYAGILSKARADYVRSVTKDPRNIAKRVATLKRNAEARKAAKAAAPQLDANGNPIGV